VCFPDYCPQNSGLDALAFLNIIVDQPETYPDFIFSRLRSPANCLGFVFFRGIYELPEP